MAPSLLVAAELGRSVGDTPGDGSQSPAGVPPFRPFEVMKLLEGAGRR